MSRKINISDYSLVNLTGYLGDIKTVEAACYIWNLKHPNDYVRVKEVIKQQSQIIITGNCSNSDEIVEICRYLTTVGVLITYEKTTVTLEI